jgi:hypothetical protein
MFRFLPATEKEFDMREVEKANPAWLRPVVIIFILLFLISAVWADWAMADGNEYVKEYVPSASEEGKVPRSIQGVWLTRNGTYFISKDTFRLVQPEPQVKKGGSMFLLGINTIDGKRRACNMSTDKDCTTPYGWEYKLKGDILTTIFIDKNGNEKTKKINLTSPHPGVIRSIPFEEDGTLTKNPMRMNLWVRPDAYVQGLANWTWRTGAPSQRNSDVFTCCHDDRYVNFLPGRIQTKKDAFTPYAKMPEFDIKGMVQMYRIFRQPYTMTYTTGGMTEDIYFIPVSLKAWLIKRKNSAGRWISSPYNVRNIVINERINDPAFWNRGAERAGGYSNGNIGTIQVHGLVKKNDDIAYFPWKKANTKHVEKKPLPDTEEELVLPDKVLAEALEIMVNDRPGKRKRGKLEKIFYVYSRDDRIDLLAGVMDLDEVPEAAVYPYFIKSMEYKIEDVKIEATPEKQYKKWGGGMDAFITVKMKGWHYESVMRKFYSGDGPLDHLKFAEYVKKNFKKLIKDPENFDTWEASFKLTNFTSVTDKLLEVMNEKGAGNIKAEDLMGRWVIVDMDNLFD